MIKERNFKVFVDFDGTISSKDIGDAIFSKFGESEKVNKIIEDLLSDRIASRDCWDMLCESVENIDQNELNEFIDTIEIEPTFKSFVNFCKENELELFVLSDGFDYYIDRKLKSAGLAHLKYYANELSIKDNRFVASYPYFNPEYGSSANCKRDHIINHSSDEDITIYIGDGNSDKEAAPFCDYIFAKDGLLKYCEKERISFFPFKDFDEVSLRITDLLKKKNPKKRHQAVLKRKNAYIIE